MKQVSSAEMSAEPYQQWASYDPLYDPLTRSHPGTGQDYAPTYWAATAGPAPQDDGPVSADSDTDVVVIGSGFTGLSCALHLAREHGIKATVLEANRVAWGCTSRNGGQAQLASGRLSRSEWIARWGLDTARRLHAEILDAMETFKGLVAEIDCDPQPGGHLFVAHKPAALAKLEAEAKVLRDSFDYPVEMLSRAQLHDRYFREDEAVGAMHEPEGIGVHPLKLAYGYLRGAGARRAGPSGQPRHMGGDQRRRPLPAHARRDREGARSGGGHRRLHFAGAASTAAQPDHADPVKFDGDAPARVRRDRRMQLPHP